LIPPLIRGRVPKGGRGKYLLKKRCKKAKIVKWQKKK